MSGFGIQVITEQGTLAAHPNTNNQKYFGKMKIMHVSK